MFISGGDPRYLKAAACAKHFAVHSGPEALRHGFDAIVSRRDLYATYLPAFRKLVREARVEAVMGAYNRTNGESCCASQYLIEEILRGEWGFAGHVVSDCGALDDLHQSHHVTADAAESAALALRRGCDLECGHVVTPDMLLLVDDEGRARLEPGQFRLLAGGCSPGPRGQALGAAEPLTAVIEVVS